MGCADLNDGVGFRSLNFPSLLNPFIPSGFGSPPTAPDCLWPLPAGPVFTGHVNKRTAGGLTPLGFGFRGDTRVARPRSVVGDHGLAGGPSALGQASREALRSAVPLGGQLPAGDPAAGTARTMNRCGAGPVW